LTANNELSASGPRPCGSCSLCCKLYEVPELDKPVYQWCRHFAKGKGCTIHATRPDVCRNYQCAWSHNTVLDDSWRPDNAHFIMEARENELTIIPDPAFPDAWRREPYHSRIRALAVRNGPVFTLVLLRYKGRIIIVFPEAEIDLGPNQPDMMIFSGYEMRGAKRAPYARFGPKPASAPA